VNYRVIDRLVRPGIVVMDVGASTGTFSARMLQLVGRRGRVYAIEPHPDEEPALRLIAKHSRRFTYFLVSASDEDGRGTLVTPIHDGHELGYDGWALFEQGLRPIQAFDVRRDQQQFPTEGFGDVMPRSYVNDFLFVAQGLQPPGDLMARAEGR
jgi:hypothetical protein